MKPLIAARNVSKKFCGDLRLSRWYGLRDIALEMSGRGYRNGNSLRPAEFWALRDVSFELGRGESLAVIGENGAGKSTLLKLLSGLIRPDAGSIEIGGTVTALIELGSGLDPHLTGRENVHLRGSLFGLGRRELRELEGDIVEFAELHESIDSPVKFYSSGMSARLGFAITAHLNPDIMLVDEVIATGDLDFQRKCIEKMREYIYNGGSVVLVSHSSYHIQSVCTRGVLIHEGCLVYDGDVGEALYRYLNVRGETNTVPARSGSSGERKLTVESIDLTGPDGPGVRTHDDVRLKLRYRATEDIQGTCWGFNIWTPDERVCVAGAGDGMVRNLQMGQGELSCEIKGLPLLPGHYLLKGAIADAESKQVLATFGIEGRREEISIQGSQDAATVASLGNGQLVELAVEWQ